MKMFNAFWFRGFLLLTALQLVSACSVITGVKPVMPIEQGISVYTIQNTPAPTVLLFPGCGGAHAKDVKDILPRKAKWLNEQGFNAVVFDFVKVVGLDNACLGQIKPEQLLDMAFAAFRYTASQPFVDKDHIVLLGWSMGGSMALAVAQRLPPEQRPNITAVAAYYPGCFSGLQFSSHPTLLLMGLADNVVDPYACLALADKSPQAPLTLKTYAGVYHNFDVIEFKEPQSAHFFWKTFTSAYNEPAAEDAQKTLLSFLREHNGQ